MSSPLPLRALFLLAIGFGTPSTVMAGDDESPPEGGGRIRQLEQDLHSLREEFDEYRKANPPGGASSSGDLQDAVDAYLARSSPELPKDEGRGLRLGGYMTVSYLDNQTEASRFDLNRLVLSAAGAISEGIDFTTEIEFEGGGITDEFQGEIAVEQATVTFRLAELFNPKLGWLLIPFGHYNLYHDDPMNDFTVRPFTARFLVPTGFGQPGIGASGSTVLGTSEHVLTYDIVLTNGFLDGFNAEEGTGEARQNGDNNDGKQVWGRLAAQLQTAWTDHLEIGISGTYGIYDDNDHDAVSGYAFDLLVRKGPFEGKGEFIAYQIGRSSEDPPGAVRGQSGLWIEGGWHFFPPAWRKPIRGLVTETSCFVLCARYQRMDLDDRVSGATFEDDLSAFSLGLNYRITERSVFRFDYTWYFAESGSDQGEFTFSFSTYF